MSRRPRSRRRPAGEAEPAQAAGGPGAGSRRRRRSQRADLLLVERGLADSRSKAQALILAGQVHVGDQRVDKAGDLLPLATELRVERGPRFVSRGGDKLDHGCQVFEAHGLVVTGTICVDIGAATGGFTDCLLQRGASRVHAVDVGRGLLHQRLRADERVVVREGVNARFLTGADFAEAIDLVVVDASFIGLGKLTDALQRIVPVGGELIALVKPQFEAGRSEVSRGRGVIRDEAVREQAIAQARGALEAAGFDSVAETDSPLRGPKGNLERLLYARRAAPPPGTPESADPGG